MLSVLLRTVIIYILLLFAIRIAGKRQIGELQLSELITTLMLSELAILPISDTSIPLSHALFPIAVLLALEYLISLFVSNFPSMRKFFFGAPSLLIHNGKLNMKEMKKLRIGIGELLSELRLKDIANIGDVHCAILEDNGKLSVFTNAAKAPLTPSDCGIQVSEAGVALPLIISGTIMHDSIAHAGLDEEWVQQKVRQLGYTVRDILLMCADRQNAIVYITHTGQEGTIQKHE